MTCLVIVSLWSYSTDLQRKMAARRFRHRSPMSRTSAQSFSEFTECGFLTWLEIFFKNCIYSKTRMHSSRTRTVRCSRGGVCPVGGGEGVCLPGGCLPACKGGGGKYQYQFLQLQWNLLHLQEESILVGCVLPACKLYVLKLPPPDVTPRG